MEELARSMLVKTNDMHLVLYVSSLIRSIIALHDLVNNKLHYKELDEQESKKDDKTKKKNAVPNTNDSTNGNEKDDGSKKDNKK